MAVYNYLSNVQISIIGESSGELTSKIKENVFNGGGTFDPKVSKDTTHAILVGAQVHQQEGIDSAVDFGAVVLHRKWLDVCSMHKQLVPVQPFSIAPGSKLFSGLKFTSSEMCLGDKIKLAALITYHGGEFSRCLDVTCTHLVTHRPRGEKYEKRGLSPNMICVTAGWVLVSSKKRYLVNPEDYDPAQVIPGSDGINNQHEKLTDVKNGKQTPTKAARSTRKKTSSIKLSTKSDNRKRGNLKKVQILTSNTLVSTVNSAASPVSTINSQMQYINKLSQGQDASGQTLLTVTGTIPSKNEQDIPNQRLLSTKTQVSSPQYCSSNVQMISGAIAQLQTQQVVSSNCMSSINQSISRQIQVQGQTPVAIQNGHIIDQLPQFPPGVQIQGYRVEKMDVQNSGSNSPQIISGIMNSQIRATPGHIQTPEHISRTRISQANFTAPVHNTTPKLLQKHSLMPPSMTCVEEELDQSLITPSLYPIYADNFIAPSNLCFIGCVFFFDDALKHCTAYSKGEKIEKKIRNWKRGLITYGALVEETYNAVTCTHVVSESYHSEVVQRALLDNIRCVTPFWLEWIIEKRKMSLPLNLLHLPLPVPFNAQISKEKLRISISHFKPKTNTYVQHALSKFNVTLTKMLYRDTDVILLPRPFGDKYNTASRYSTPCINLLWLRHILLQQEDAGNDGWKKDKYNINHSLATQALCVDEKEAFDQRLLTPWKQPIKIEVDFEQRAKLRRVEEKEDIENNSDEPQAKKTKVISYKAQPRVTFSGFNDDELKELMRKVQAVGGVLAEYIYESTHLVSKKFKRTIKWFAGINRVNYIVHPDWVNESYNSKWFLDEKQFWLNDEESEKRYQFNLRDSLQCANEKRVFCGYRFAILSSQIRPPRHILGDIILSGGGRLLSQMPSIKSLKQVKKLRDDDPTSCNPVIILSSTEKSEYEYIRILRDNGISCFSPELILSASLRQKLELSLHQIRENGKIYP